MWEERLHSNEVLPAADGLRNSCILACYVDAKYIVL